jgi:uncharacterized protein
MAARAKRRRAVDMHRAESAPMVARRLLDAVARTGPSMPIKVDGERAVGVNPPIYTVVISGPADAGPIRFGDSDLNRATARVAAALDASRLSVRIRNGCGRVVVASPVPGLAVAVAVLVVANLLNNRWATGAYLPTSLVTSALLLGLFELAGFTLSDAGLGRAELARGARSALVLVTLVALGYLVAAKMDASRGVFLDRRVEQARLGSAAYQVLVRIPVGTVVLEEVAFRGVLYALLRHAYGTASSTAVSCWLFGLWHVLPARELPKLNPVAGRMFHTRPPLVVAAVTTTALTGAVLCELRRRTGSLLPPIALHWAINALGYVTAFVVTRSRRGT